MRTSRHSGAAVLLTVVAVVGLMGGLLTARMVDDRPNGEASAPDPSAGGESGTPPDGGVLYHAAGRIHDGDVTAPYQPTGRLLDLMSVQDGWVTLEGGPSMGRRIVHVRDDGSTTEIATGRMPSLDVSADREHLVYPDIESVDAVLVDAATGDVVKRVDTGDRPTSAQFSADDVIVTTKTMRGESVSRWNPTRGRLTHLQSEVAADSVSQGGELMTLSTSSVQRYGCPSVVQADRPADELWTDCSVVVQSDEGSFSPDGRSLLAVDRLTDGLGPTWVAIVDSATGEEVGRITEELMTSLEWVDDDTVAVRAARDERMRSWRVYTCSTGGECEQEVDAVKGDVTLGRRS